VYKLLGIGHYGFSAESFTEFPRHLYQNYKKKNEVIWIKGKNTKNHTSWKKNQWAEKKVKGKCACYFGSKFVQ